jgi:peptidoglycan/LPS O-acetylase OafA/YrhL
MVYLQRPVFQLLCTWSMLYQILFYFCVPLLVNAVLQVIR